MCIAVEKRTSARRMIKRIVWAAVPAVCVMTAFRSCGAGAANAEKKKSEALQTFVSGMAGEFDAVLYDTFLPAFAFAQANAHETYWLLQKQLDSLIPAYGYLTSGMTEDVAQAGEQTERQTLLLTEAELDGQSGGFLEQYSGQQAEQLQRQSQDGETETGGGNAADMALAELLQAENEAALYMHNQGQTSFVPHGKQAEVDIAPLCQYETLVQQFYTVDANTMAGSGLLDVKKFLEQDMTVDKNGEEPRILIYHTHSQEAFADSAPGEISDSIVGVGEHLAQILTDTYGYKVLHHTGQYDVESRNDAYSVALPAIERILEENPSVQVVIDLHRDEMAEGTRLVTEIDGRPTARFMFFNGLSRTKKTGNIAYLYNENLESNLAFSFQMQLKAMEYYPGLTRKIYLKGYRYNMHLRPRYLLIELGAQNNTVEEAMNACEPLAHILDLVLSGETD